MRPSRGARQVGLALLIALGLLAAREVFQRAQEPPEPVRLAAPRAALVASAVAVSVAPTAAAASEPPVARAALSRVTQTQAVGSEGFGVHVERAHASGGPRQAWQAYRWLMSCRRIENTQREYRAARDAGVAQQAMTHLMQDAAQTERLCQTVLPEHQALAPALAQRAMEGGVLTAATHYAGLLDPSRLSTQQRDAVLAAVRRNARSGDSDSLLAASGMDGAWGLSDLERLSYLSAVAADPERPAGIVLANHFLQNVTAKLSAPPSAALFQEAAREAEALLIAAGKPPKGGAAVILGQ